ncbi:unnamed protein product [Amaranthus hypochondriacus]
MEERRQEEMGEKQRNTEQVIINVCENKNMRGRLKYAAVIEFSPPINCVKAAALINDMKLQAFRFCSSISPLKMVLFFDDDYGLEYALDESSPLRETFDHVRKWKDNESCMERAVWLECSGLHPYCWSEENLLKIGNIWGKAVEVVDVFNGVHSISTAKILVITKKTGRIDKRVKVVAEHGSGIIWVKESQCCACLGNFNGADEMETQSKNQRHGQMNWREVRQPTVSIKEHTPAENNETRLEEKGVEDDDYGEEGSEEGDDVEDDDYEQERLEEKGVEDVNYEEERLEQEPAHISEDNGVAILNEDIAHDGILDEQYEEYGMQNQNSAMQEVEWNHQTAASGGFEDHNQLFTKECIGHCNEFDPISSIEVGISLKLAEYTATNSAPNVNYASSARTNGRSHKRARGRPKRVAQSLPEPLYVPSTPTNGIREPIETWNTVKRLGVRTPNDGVVVSALRRSRRLLALDDTHPVG